MEGASLKHKTSVSDDLEHFVFWEWVEKRWLVIWWIFLIRATAHAVKITELITRLICPEINWNPSTLQYPHLFIMSHKSLDIDHRLLIIQFWMSTASQVLSNIRNRNIMFTFFQFGGTSHAVYLLLWGGWAMIREGRGSRWKGGAY